jgi:hypothetical protein
MNFSAVEKIADAVLYEGYILYPYRPSALKNCQRWSFGTLYPRTFAENLSSPESWFLRAEVLLEGDAQTTLDLQIRFLQIAATNADQEWNEGFARSKMVEAVTLCETISGIQQDYNFSSLSAEEREQAPRGFTSVPLTGHLSLRATELRVGLYRLTATFANETSLPHPLRAAAQASAFTSAHLLLGVEGGSFVSLLEPPSELEAATRACRNQGVFPVLAGEDRSCMLCSPIILYDYPQIAPESAGDFFDGTEMDEMLALRVLTLTDEEKAQVRQGDAQARAILDRMETLPGEHLLKLHGAVRGLRTVAERERQEAAGGIQPWNPFAEQPTVDSVTVFGTEVRPGTRVRLWPRKRADILDMAMAGKIAIVEAIEQDLEDQVQLAVVLEDDPGRDMGLLRQAGHRFFYTPEEIEPLSEGAA